MYDIIIVGCGVSSFSFLKGLEKNKKYVGKNIALICPSEYKDDTKLVDIEDISPKFLQKSNLLSLSYYLSSLGKTSAHNIVNIGVHGMGGMARIWGGSIGTFNQKTIERNNLNYKELLRYYTEMKDFLPYSGNNNDKLKPHFKLPQSESVKISNKITKLFGTYLKGTFKVGSPRLLVKDTCDNCNQCLIGCHNDSVWYPKQSDFNDLESFNLTIINNSFVKKINSSSVIIEDTNITYKLQANKIILGAGVVQNFKLLAQLSKKEDCEAKLYTTPAISFAFLNFNKNKSKEFFGMGNATFILSKNNSVDIFGNFYDGYSLALSKGLVFSKNYFVDKVFKIASKYMVAGAAFMSSDNTNCTISYKHNVIKLDGKYTNEYYKNKENYFDKIKQFIKELGSFTVHLKASKIGADIHYAGGIPKSLYDKDLIVDGCLKNIQNIQVLGGSTFSYLSPESPTLSFMANSYRIGKLL